MPTASVGFSPLDEELRLWEGRYSEGLVQQVVWLTALVVFEEAEAILERIGGLHLSDSSIWRRAQDWAVRLGVELELERVRANAVPGRYESPQLVEPGKRMGASMDGAMMNIRDEGWKEFKVGAVFELEMRPTKDDRTGEMVDMAHAVNNTYAAHLGSPEPFGQLLWSEAQRRGWEHAAETQVVGDGAAWIWNLTQAHFPYSLQVVDWYHAMDHLALAARLYKGEGTPAAKHWLKTRETTLYQGRADRIATELTRAAADPQRTDHREDLIRAANYFQHNQHRMYYLQMREDEWIIGSGMVESAAKQFKARLTGPGMRWSRSGAENLLLIRALVLSRRFDSLWAQAANSPPN